MQGMAQINMSCKAARECRSVDLSTDDAQCYEGSMWNCETRVGDLRETESIGGPMISGGHLCETAGSHFSW
jgi:hypothetical protein